MISSCPNQSSRSSIEKPQPRFEARLPVIRLGASIAFPGSSNDLVKETASCLEDAKASYTISFDSPPADHPDQYHDLEVKIDKPGLKARTRTGYYAQPYGANGR